MGEYIDTRALVDRLEELNDERKEIEDRLEALENDTEMPADILEQSINETTKELEEFDRDNGEEIAQIEEIEQIATDFQYGETLIPKEDFIDYVEEMLVDCGDLPRNIPWYIEIDWDKTAENIKVDYSEVEYLGNTYYVRDC